VSSLEHEPVSVSSPEYDKSEELVCVSDNPILVCMYFAIVIQAMKMIYVTQSDKKRLIAGSSLNNMYLKFSVR